MVTERVETTKLHVSGFEVYLTGAKNARSLQVYLKHREPFPDPNNPGWLRCPGCKVMFLPTYKGAG